MAEDLEQSWYDMSIEEEQERENSLTPQNTKQPYRTSYYSEPRGRGFPILSPLKEADRSQEMGEEAGTRDVITNDVITSDVITSDVITNDVITSDVITNDHVVIEEEGDYTTPRKAKLGPRAAQRHSGDRETPPHPSPRGRKVRVEMVEASPVSRDVKSRLGPRAASRHTTPQNAGNKRALSRDSPMREVEHRDKRYRHGTPNRDKNKDYQQNFSTPESIRNAKKAQQKAQQKYKTPNSDSRLYTKKSLNKSNRLAGTSKDLFGRSGKSAVSAPTEDPSVKELTEEQKASRGKQVMYGKVTDGYQNYKSIVPKNMRHLRDPASPNKDHGYSKRCWDGLLRTWRRRLHEWDDPKVGLGIRAAYTKKNKDLKTCGLVDAKGDFVMYTPPQEEDKPVPETIPEPEPVLAWNIPKFFDPVEQDSRSQDSEYDQLLGNQVDFPDTDESDTSYHLSQDSDLGRDVDLEMGDESMDCEDESVLLGSAVPSSVC